MKHAQAGVPRGGPGSRLQGVHVENRQEVAASKLYRSLSSRRRLVALLAYTTVTAGAFALAYLLRFEFGVPEGHRATALAVLPLLLAVRALCDSIFGLTVGRWRFAGIRDAVRLGISTAVGSLLLLMLLPLLGWSPPVPRSILLLEPVLSANFKAALWVGYRMLVEWRGRRSESGATATRALILGAGGAGSRLAREMMAGGTGYDPVGFVDDDRLKLGTTIEGIPVLGTGADLSEVAASRGIEAIVLAVPSASPDRLRQLVDRAQRTGLPVRVLPATSTVLGDGPRVRQLREVRIEDLLGREPVRLELPELARDLEGRVVLITGAAGSIGSELARQVALHRPSRLILVDQAESPLYFVELELIQRHPTLDLVPVVGDILDDSSMARIFRRHRPDRVFHAAAYKHVPLMEGNAVEAVRNNVVGTARMIELAGQVGAGRFVLISTDKAVDPSSVMGATKRVAELLLLTARSRFPDTGFHAVRFGNVLGSQGSVIPLFRRQLETTRRLTVTHPEVTRYFMTIPEAVQLVLQASMLEEGRGRIAMLEMGEPVRIAELASRLIRLAGLREGVDAHIEYTGLRPGEKLHERLVQDEEETFATRAPRVRVVACRTTPHGPSLVEAVRRLEANLPTLDPGEVRAVLGRLVRHNRADPRTLVPAAVASHTLDAPEGVARRPA